MLELYEGKLSRTVLRRESGRNARDLSGLLNGNKMKNKGSIALLKAIVNKELKTNIDIEKLEKNLEKAYNTIPHRLAKAVKLYFGMEKNSKGNY